MRIFDGKVYRDATDEEIKALKIPTINSLPTTDERLEALENAMQDLILLSLGGTE